MLADDFCLLKVKYGWFCQVCFTIKNKDIYNLILVESSS